VELGDLFLGGARVAERSCTRPMIMNALPSSPVRLDGDVRV
jgi:hypothetical protein